MNNAMDAWKRLTNPQARLRALLNVKNYCERHQVRMGVFARDELIRLQKEYEA